MLILLIGIMILRRDKSTLDQIKEKDLVDTSQLIKENKLTVSEKNTSLDDLKQKAAAEKVDHSIIQDRKDEINQEKNTPIITNKNDDKKLKKSEHWFVIKDDQITAFKEQITLEEFIKELVNNSLIVIKIFGQVNLEKNIEISFEDQPLQKVLDIIFADYAFSVSGKAKEKEISVYGQGDASQVVTFSKASVNNRSKGYSKDTSLEEEVVTAEEIVQNYDILTKGKSAERAMASKKLREIGQEKLSQTLIEYINNTPDDEERLKATRALFYSDTDETYEFLADLLYDPNPEIVKEAAILLEDSEEESVIPKIINALKIQRDEKLQLHILSALSEIGGDETVEGFLIAMKHELPRVRKEGVKLVIYESNASDVFMAIKQLVQNDPDPTVRVQALYSMRAFKKEDCLKVANEALKDPDLHVQEMAKKLINYDEDNDDDDDWDDWDDWDDDDDDWDDDDDDDD